MGYLQVGAIRLTHNEWTIFIHDEPVQNYAVAG